jgi:hypothetical protein
LTDGYESVVAPAKAAKDEIRSANYAVLSTCSAVRFKPGNVGETID